MSAHHMIGMMALAAVVGMWLPAAARGDEPPKRANPLSPLATIDPFVGVFDGDDLAVTIRKNEGGYAGEVVKAGQSFAFKGTRSGDTLNGAFEFEGQSFQFSITIRGEEVTFNTPQKLTRRKGAAPVARIDPAPSVPPTKPIPTPTPTPALAPVTPTVKNVPESPLELEKFLAPAAVVNPTPLLNHMRSDAGRTWAGFPQGAYVVIDEEATAAGQLPRITRVAFIYQGEALGMETVQAWRFAESKWEMANKTTTWMSAGQGFADLGYVAGKPEQETLQIDGRSVVCAAVEYTLPDGKTGQTKPRRLKTWAASDLGLPPQPFPIPRGFAVLGGGVVRVASLDGDNSGYRVNYEAVSLGQKIKVGQREIEAAAFKGKELVDSATGQIEIVYERTISGMVPGGVVKNLAEKKLGGVVLSVSSAVAVEMGMSKK